MFFIETERLKLIPLTHQLLQLCYANRAEMEQALGLNISAMQVAPFYRAEYEDALLNFWLPNSLKYPDKYQWYTTWEIVLKETNTAVGGIGFAGYANEAGEAETGYMIDELQQRKGYATEALRAITNWAFEDEYVKAVIAQTPADNSASQKLLEKAGFMYINETESLLKFRRTR
ncbi:MAG: N-acetyltransferase [Sphingobacteriales bacterium]|nr:MAG: N-acetyltransferase [Sphingobacteriales bacterium]